jgi:hypothetical protein
LIGLLTIPPLLITGDSLRGQWSKAHNEKFA